MKNQNVKKAIVGAGLFAAVSAAPAYFVMKAVEDNAIVNDAQAEIADINADQAAYQRMDPAVVAENIRQAKNSGMPTISNESVYTGRMNFAEKDIDEHSDARDGNVIGALATLAGGAAIIGAGISQYRQNQGSGTSSEPVVPTPDK